MTRLKTLQNPSVSFKFPTTPTPYLTRRLTSFRSHPSIAALVTSLSACSDLSQRCRHLLQPIDIGISRPNSPVTSFADGYICIYGPVLTLQVSILAKFSNDYLTQSILAGGGVKQGGKPTNHPSELLKWEETAAICNIVEKIYLNMKANFSN